MKTKSKKTSFLAAVALGATILAGSALPSQAQTTTVQPQATVQGVLPANGYSGWNWPTMWWPTNPNTSGAVPVVSSVPTSQPSAFWGCWGGWW